ncbi:transposase [Crateriforma conspicua]|uniref:Transposase IS200 like protein n=1 Tax=Crateriforma conspicua TaxID=2527996 RepID=A0A5C6FUM6_9PLAN|nr:transposase [Crateriforma conspicua]TWU66687.1 Transposase IS200 like protein [Crateriforma conspicua]
MNDPIAFFITIANYGTWLPGDERGWVEYQRGWKLPCRPLELEALARMSEEACILNSGQRELVESQIAETCEHREWILHAQNCRSNHLHAVIGAFETAPKKVRQDLKAWCTRRLKRETNSGRENWWAERGSIRWVFTEEELERVIEYVNDAQDRKHLEIKPDQ